MSLKAVTKAGRLPSKSAKGSGLEHQPDGLEVPFTLIFRIPVKGQM